MIMLAYVVEQHLAALMLQGFIDVTYMSSDEDGVRLSRGNKVTAHHNSCRGLEYASAALWTCRTCPACRNASRQTLHVSEAQGTLFVLQRAGPVPSEGEWRTRASQ